jgi:hypothetical protein
MRVREACTGVPPLVDQRVQIAVRVGGAAALPSLGDEVELIVGQLRDRPHVFRRVDDDLLPLERRIEVRHDPHAPAAVASRPRAARRGFRQDERLRRRHLFVSTAKGAGRQLVLRRVGERRSRHAGPPRTRRRDCDAAAAQLVNAKLGQRVRKLGQRVR